MFKLIFSDRLIRAGSSLFLFSMVSNLFNYLFQVTMGRLLGPSEYGLMNSLLSISVVIGVPLGTIIMVVSKATAEYKAEGNFRNIGSLFALTYKKVLIAGLIGLLLFLGASGYIKNYIHAPSVVPVAILGISILTSLLYPINAAILQGLQNFTWMNLGIGLGGPLRFLFCLVLVLAGFSVSGVMAGLILSGLSIWAITYIPLRKVLEFEERESNLIPPSFTNIFHVLLINLAFAVMTQADMVLVKHFFSAHEAGIYASAAILGKAVMYLPGALVLAMFPMVAESNALQLSSGPLIKKSLIVSLSLSGLVSLLFYLFPSFVIKTFFGARYTEAAEILRYFGLAMLPMALLLVLMNYFVAKGRSLFSYVMFLGALLEIGMILLFHRSLLSVIWSLLGAGGIVLSSGFAMLLSENRSEYSRIQRRAVKVAISEKQF